MSHFAICTPGFIWNESQKTFVNTKDDNTQTLAKWREYYNRLAPQGQRWNFWTQDYENISTPVQPTPNHIPISSNKQTNKEDMPKEVESMPEIFNGDICKTTKWSLQMVAYMILNSEVYNEDKKKIILILSRITKGEAEKWAEGQLKRATTSKAGFRTYNSFSK